MTTRPSGPGAGAHATHDPILISAHAAGDLVGHDLALAEARIAACAECRALHAEVRSIAATARSLPPRPRPAGRAFTISPDQARALARGGVWRRFLRPFGRSGSGATRPLAATFVTLGLAGLLIASLPTLPLGAGAAFQAATGGSPGHRDVQAPSLWPVGQPTGEATSEGGGGGAAIDTGGGTAGPSSPGPDGKDTEAPAATPGQAGNDGAAGGEAVDGGTGGGPGGDGGPSPLAWTSVALLGAGLLLFTLRRAALRLR